MADEYGDMNVTFPNAQLVTTNSFFLGTYAGLTDEKIQYIKEAVDGFFSKREL
jgi:dTDP-4-amino-4,6-dideoxygalactose transaminase